MMVVHLDVIKNISTTKIKISPKENTDMTLILMNKMEDKEETINIMMMIIYIVKNTDRILLRKFKH